MEDCFFSGRIADLSIFNVQEFGLRAGFKIERPGQAPIVCAVSGEVAQKFVGRYREGDIVVVGGVHEPRPSTAAGNTPWNGRFRVRAVCAGSRVEFAMEPISSTLWVRQAIEPATEPALAQ
jgi:hypothetical protein